MWYMLLWFDNFLNNFFICLSICRYKTLSKVGKSDRQNINILAGKEIIGISETKNNFILSIWMGLSEGCDSVDRMIVEYK